MSRSRAEVPQQTPDSQDRSSSGGSWWDNSFLQSLLGAGSTGGQYGTAGAMGREGSVQAMHRAAYNLGADAPRSNFNGDVFRNNSTNYAQSMFEAQHGAGWGGRYNASGQQLIYTSPTHAESVGEAGAYNGMANRTMVRANYQTNYDPVTGQGGLADVTTAAQRAGMTEALTPHVGKQGPGRLWNLFGEHPYTQTQQVGKGATDAGAGAVRVPSATGGNQIDIIPRNNGAGSITPLEVTPFDAHGTAQPTVRAGTPGAPAINGMGIDATPLVEGQIPHGPGSTLRAPSTNEPTPPGRASSVRYGAVGGGLTALGTDLYRMANGEDVGLGQTVLDTGVGTAVGAGGALATDALMAAGRGATSAGGIVGGVIEGGMSAWNNANAYANGQIDGSHAIANTVVDTGIGVGAGAAGAAMGAAIGSIIPGAGTLVGAGLGFLGGMAGSYLVHALSDKTGFANWAKEGLASGISWAGDGLSAAGGAIADGAGAAWEGIQGAGSAIADGAGAAWDGISSAGSAIGSGISSAGSAAWDGISSAGSAIGSGISSAGSAIADGAGAVWDTLTGW